MSLELTKNIDENFSALLKFLTADINKYLSSSLIGQGFSQEKIDDNEENIREIGSNLRRACSGDSGARDTSKDIIYDHLIKVVTRQNINKFIIFDDFAKPYTKWETIVYKLNSMSGLQLLQSHMTEHQTDTILQGNVKIRDNSHVVTSLAPFFEYFEGKTRITEQDLDKYYSEQHYNLSFEEQLDILTQICFSLTYGLGVIDSLNAQSAYIEEIQIGMNGVFEKTRNYIDQINNVSRLDNTAKDAVHIIIHGHTIQLCFLSFKTNYELERVIRNLIQDCNCGDLTKKNPSIVTSSVDGRRISVARPPFQDSWGGFIRKFNFAAAENVQAWDKSLPKDYVELQKLLVLSGSNIYITGTMSAGKTTLLRTYLAETPEGMSIRTIENGSFELEGRRYFPNRDVSAYKTDDVPELSETAVQAFVRKTSGHIFAIGETNSFGVGAMYINLSKFVPQVFATGHFNNSNDLVTYHKNALLCTGYSNERLAEAEAVMALNLHIHIKATDHRYISSIDEILYTPSVAEKSMGTTDAVDNLRDQLSKTRNYTVHNIYSSDGKNITVDIPSDEFFDRLEENTTKDTALAARALFERLKNGQR